MCCIFSLCVCVCRSETRYSYTMMFYIWENLLKLQQQTHMNCHVCLNNLSFVTLCVDSLSHIHQVG